jgi:hypothetical protein
MNLRTDNERSIYRKAHDAVLKATKPQVSMAKVQLATNRAKNAGVQIIQIIRALDRIYQQERQYVESDMLDDFWTDVRKELDSIGPLVRTIADEASRAVGRARDPMAP